ncbi:MAG: phosphate acetyltransferase [Gammaproteobacteria bacterium]
MSGQFELGQAAEVSRSFSANDVAGYSALGGHAVADESVPEPLIYALFSYLLGVELPGIGTNYLKQESRFVAPAAVDDTLTARVEITKLRLEKHLVDLETTCHAGDGTLVCDGRALVYVRDVGLERS